MACAIGWAVCEILGPNSCLGQEANILTAFYGEKSMWMLVDKYNITVKPSIIIRISMFSSASWNDETEK